MQRISNDVLPSTTHRVSKPRDPELRSRARVSFPLNVYLWEDEVLGTLDEWVQTVPGLLSYGRQGLFAHDNTHHALLMAYSAVSCVTGDGGFDLPRWAGYLEIFKTHVVED